MHTIYVWGNKDRAKTLPAGHGNLVRALIIGPIRAILVHLGISDSSAISKAGFGGKIYNHIEGVPLKTFPVAK